MASPSSYDQNGLISQRRLSRAYDQPIVHTSKGVMSVHQDLDGGGMSESTSGSGVDLLAYRFQSLGDVVAKVTLCSLAIVGALVSLVGRASLEPLSQLFGFMLMVFLTFIACTGTFFWWGGTCGAKVGLGTNKVLHIYILSVCCDGLARFISIFAATPPMSVLPEDTSYFASLATLLFFPFACFIHKGGLNAMFSRETVLFVVCTMVLNFSSVCLFMDVLPHFVLPQMVYTGTLLGLSLSLMGYQFPKLSASGIYWMLSQSGGPPRQVVAVEPSFRVSVDHSGSPSRRESYSSTMSSQKPASRISASSVSSMNSFNPQGFDSEMASEARGLLTELLFHKDSLPSETRHKLRRVKDILAPRIDRIFAYPKVRVGNQIYDDHDYESDLSSTCGTTVSSSSSLRPGSYISGTHLTVQPRIRKHRSASVVQMRRSSSNYAATTTTDTGMPVLENEPVERARSQALRDVKARISIQEKRLSVHRMGRERLGSLGSEGSRLPLPRMHRKDVSSLSNTSLSAAESDLSESESTFALSQLDEEDAVGRQPVASSPKLQYVGKLGSLEEGTNLEIITEGAELQVCEGRPRSATLPTILDFPSPVSDGEKKAEEGGKNADSGDDGRALDANKNQHNFYSFTRYRKPSKTLDLSEYTSNEHLDMFENVAVWDYPIFELEENAGNHILSHMAHMLFHEAGLMETFRIPQREFVNYFRSLEANYGNNVYHNKTHAADVLHAVSYLLFEIIPEFSHEFSYNDSQREWKGYIGAKASSGGGGNIASAFSILEVLACYMASAMHDFDHPGRTNAFLVGTKSSLAVLYNDRSVLENHHAAASWHLLTNFEENNFLATLEEAEMKRLRFLIIEAILATDLKMHFDILSSFRAKVDPDEGGGIDWSTEIDRMLVMKMLIKMADINTPTKSLELHRKWTDRITEEFYQQSEEEEALHLPHTIFMDRNHPEKLPAVQLSFIQHLVSPLFQACAQAGIIPGISEPVQPRVDSTPPTTPLALEPEGGANQVEEAKTVLEIEESVQSGEDAFGMQEESNFMSILLTNLEVNYEAWKAELPAEEEDLEEETKEGAAEEETVKVSGEDAEKEE